MALTIILGTTLNCLFDLTTRPTTNDAHYLGSGIGMRWQMGIRGGHYGFRWRNPFEADTAAYTWWRNPWPKDFVDYKYKGG